MSNSTSTATPGTTQPSDIDFSSPVTVLPLVAALVTILGIFVGACFIYHRRQRKRTQELVRQLRTTERRIDAIGMLTAKKQQALAAKKAEYCPPVAAPCSSVSTLGISNAYATQPVQVPETQLSAPSSTTYEGEEKTFTVTVQVNENCLTTDESESKLDNNTSYYCSTCKLEESVSESVLAQYRVATDNINSSMAVECATIPAVSSLSTVYSTNRDKSAYKVHNRLVKSRSELHRRTLRDQLSKQSLRLMRGLGLASSSNSTESSENKTAEQPDILPRRSIEQDTRRSMERNARRSMERDPRYSDPKEQNTRRSTGQHTISSIGQEMGQDTRHSIEIDRDTRRSMERDTRRSMDRDSGHAMRQDVRRSMDTIVPKEQDTRRSMERDVRRSVERESGLRHSIGQDIRHSMELNTRHSMGQQTVSWSSEVVTYMGETTTSESELSVLGGGRPNSPATLSRQEDSEVTLSVTDGCTTDTEGKREKWV